MGGGKIEENGPYVLNEYTLFTFSVTNTMNSTMENHRQWRITRKDIAEFLELKTTYYLLYNSVIYFHLCLEV